MKPAKSNFWRWKQGRVHLKIGIDTGRTLVRFAKSRPDELFVGVEKKVSNAGIAVRRCEIDGLRNVVVRNIEAHQFVRKRLLKEFFSFVHIYFPTPEFVANNRGTFRVQDPLITRSFLNDLSFVTKTGGIIRILTDSVEYFDDIQNSVSLSQWWPQEWTYFGCNQSEDEFIGTPCERQFRTEGRTILPLQLKKIS